VGSGVADTRIHGTTRQQLEGVNTVEARQTVALDLVPVFEKRPPVHRDGYVELKTGYYSVPPEYVGRKSGCLEARLLRVINHRREVIAVHALARNQPRLVCRHRSNFLSVPN